MQVLHGIAFSETGNIVSLLNQLFSFPNLKVCQLVDIYNMEYPFWPGWTMNPVVDCPFLGKKILKYENIDQGYENVKT